MADIRCDPPFAKNRGAGYWLHPRNLIAARRKFLRPDHTNAWRYTFGDAEPPDRSMSFAHLLKPDRLRPEGFCFVILGDTGEGDKSQYGLVPLLRALKPDFMIINGDIAYPAGRISARDEGDDYVCGFFEPYRGFDCPIWAVPGNHEYYAEGRGREFYNIFCSRVYASRWDAHDIRLVPQPGLFWELKDPDRKGDLVVIGIDTGQEANLDGGRKWWKIWKSNQPEDTQQHNWLAERLAKAQADKHKVVVLFHIPGLVREINDGGTRLKTLHRIIASFSCVKLVVCGHEHNYQQYEPARFQTYLKAIHKTDAVGPPPHYIVSGGGGAYLTTTDFKSGEFTTKYRYPTVEQWSAFASFGKKVVAALNLSKGILGRLAAFVDKSSLVDADQPRYLSFLFVTVDRSTPGDTVTTVTPVFMDDVKSLYRHLPEETVVDIMERNPQVDRTAVAECLQDGKSPPQDGQSLPQDAQRLRLDLSFNL